MNMQKWMRKVMQVEDIFKFVFQQAAMIMEFTLYIQCLHTFNVGVPPNIQCWR